MPNRPAEDAVGLSVLSRQATHCSNEDMPAVSGWLTVAGWVCALAWPEPPRAFCAVLAAAPWPVVRCADCSGTAWWVVGLAGFTALAEALCWTMWCAA